MDVHQMVAHKLHYYKQVQKQIDAHRTKAASIHLRNQWLEKQKKNNYQMEYDRIRGLLSQSVVNKGPNTVEHLQARKKRLEDMGAKMIDSIDLIV